MRLVRPVWTGALVLAAAVGVSACGAGTKTGVPSIGTPSAKTVTLPGTGKPPISIGDKNTTEQFLLGQLFTMALQAEGYTVYLNPNIGPTDVTLSALASGRLDLYPEYLVTWDRSIAGYQQQFHSRFSAYQAGQRYALAHGLELLDATPFSDSAGIIVGSNYAAQNGLTTIGDLAKVAPSLTLGGPPEFQQDPNGLPAVEQAYGFQPAAFKQLEVGGQYQAIDQGTVGAAWATTTDGQLISGNYTVLADPMNVFGWGNVVPVASARVVDSEGPGFVSTINRVSSLLTVEVMRELNAAVDLSHETPAAVAKQFLISRGLIPAAQG